MSSATDFAVIVSAALLLLGCIGSAHACSCAERTFAEQIERAPVVLVARVEATENPRFQEVWDNTIGRLLGGSEPSGIRVEVEVIRTLRGNAASLTALQTGYSAADCGLPVRAGDIRLFAPDLDGHVWQCTASRRLPAESCAVRDALDDLEAHWAGGGPILWQELPGTASASDGRQRSGNCDYRAPSGRLER